MQELLVSEVKSLIDRVGAKLGYDFTYEPEFPNGRTDVCAICRLAENGNDYGFDTIFLVWKEPNGSIQHKEIGNTRETKKYLSVGSIEITPDGEALVRMSDNRSYRGAPWSQEMKDALKR